MLRGIVLDVLNNVPIFHPLGDHDKPRIRSVIPVTDADGSQDVWMVQVPPRYHLFTKPSLKQQRDVTEAHFQREGTMSCLTFQVHRITCLGAPPDTFESHVSAGTGSLPNICEPSYCVVRTGRVETNREDEGFGQSLQAST